MKTILVLTLLLSPIFVLGQTQLLKNINSNESYVGDYQMESPIEFNGHLYFIAHFYSSDIHELWKSDGTEFGTKKVTEVFNGNGVHEIYKFNNMLFFSAISSNYGIELWKTDGTTAGTTLVKDLSPGTGSGNPGNFCVVGSELFFTANYNGFEFELWKSDGTAAGTTFLKSIASISFTNAEDWFTTANNFLFFYNYTDGNGTTMWRSDGTSTGTFQVTDDQGNPIYNNGIPYPINNKIIFTGQTNSTDVQHLWVSDGTAMGTMQLYEDTVWEVKVIANEAFFSVDNTNDQKEIWSTNGTLAGTNLNYIIPAQYNHIGFVGGYNDTLIYNAQDLSSQVPMTSNRLSLNNNTALVIQNNIVNTIIGEAAQGVVVSASSNVLWHGDELNHLVNSTCTEIGEIRPGTIGANIKPLKQIGNLSFFSAEDGESNTQLWCLDLSNLEYLKLTDIGIQPQGADIENLLELNGQLYFSANDGINGLEPWVSDGTDSGTHLVKDINSGSASSFIRDFAELNGEMYFFTIAPDESLYKTDGTELGTTLVSNIEYLGSKRFTKLNGELYFVRGGLYNNEMWKTDGTTAGTQLAFSIFDSTASIVMPYTIGNHIIFQGNDGTGQTTWFISDGTMAGTQVANPSDTDPKFSNFTSNIYLYDNKIVASIHMNNNILSIYSLDETAPNATLIAEFTGYPQISGYNQATNTAISQNFMYTVLSQSPNDFALWRIDLSNNTSELIYDSEFYISAPFVLNDTIYFNSGNKVRGVTNLTNTPFEVMNNFALIENPTPFENNICLLGTFSPISNGFSTGPQSWISFDGQALTPLINPQLGLSFLGNRTIVGDRIYFTANNSILGNELWYYSKSNDSVPTIYLDTANCVDFLWSSSNETYQTSGFYYQAIEDISGNDSLHLFLNLSIYNPFNATISGAPFIVPTDVSSCTGLLYLDVGTADLFATIDSLNTSAQANEVIVAGSLCHGIHFITVSDSCGYSYSSVFIIPYPEETITNVSGANALDSIGFIVENCTLSYDDIDTSFITSITVIDSTATVEWRIIDIFGNIYIEIATYNIPEGPGNYIFQISLFCPTRVNEQVFAITQDIQNMLYVEAISENYSTVSIYPNPTESNLTVTFEGQIAKYTIYDMQGKLVITNNVNSGEQISISELNDGMYFLELITEKENVLKRIIKK
ncbi:MAG: ELWxxDGT repeat protein [Bacteroidota bacterium]